MTQIISRKDLLTWLGQLIKDHTLIAPTSTAELTLFQPITQVEEVVLDFDYTVLSPKGWFFPATETLFAVERKNGQTELIPADIEPETVIFGLHPCDAKGIALLDKTFLEAPADTIYQQHRDKTTLVGLSCRKTCPECFCTSLGGAPDDPSHLDILLTELEDGYIVQAVTGKGKALLAGASVKQSEMMPSPPPPVPEVPAEGLAEAMQRGFDDPYWSLLADRCIHCNLCAYVCPTCYCFDVRDCVDKGKVQRVRTWESCQSPGFTKIAGGYNPRSTKGARLRQRFYHKLLYFPKEFGSVSCVGCGRCVRICPVNIDIREVIAGIQKLGV